MYEQAVVVVVVVIAQKRNHRECTAPFVFRWSFRIIRTSQAHLFLGMMSRISRGAGGINLDRWEIWN